jgi:cation:H+ antiporter
MHFLALPAALNLLIFAVAAAAVWLAGTRLTTCADALAERMGWSRALMGFLLLAGVTELPELATTITACASGEAHLALSNLFGGVPMQTAILAVADLRFAGRPLTFFAPRAVLLLQGAALVVLLATTLAVGVLGDLPLAGWFGLAPVLLLGAYLGILRMLQRYGHRVPWQPVEVLAEVAAAGASKGGKGTSWSLRRMTVGLVLAAVVVGGAGVLLALTAAALAVQTRLGATFVGGTLLAASTSLPEVSTTLAAVRLGAPDMAVANIFGSNMIMVALLLPADVAYAGGPVLSQVEPAGLFLLASGILGTAVYLMGLIERRNRTFLHMGIDSWAVAVLYAATLAGVYALG